MSTQLPTHAMHVVQVNKLYPKEFGARHAGGIERIVHDVTRGLAGRVRI